MPPLDFVKLDALMELTSGRSETVVGLIDGPVAFDHPDLVKESIKEIPGGSRGTCSQADSAACMHGTFVAGVLCARRGSVAPAICPDCTMLVRPIFLETPANGREMPGATPGELTAAILDCVKAGARVINLSVTLTQSSLKSEPALEAALDHASRRGAVVVAAAGNQGSVGSSPITRHPWVIPVVACNLQGKPTTFSNLGNSIGKRGLCAPGEGITSIGADGKSHLLAGTSIATPFVTGAIALLLSIFPSATAAQVKMAVAPSFAPRRTTIVPPVLNAWAAYQALIAHLY
jgi:subtilisin family serine protease